MKSHRQIQSLLYEYFTKELVADDVEIVEKHLSTCPACAAEAKAIRALLEIVDAGEVRASDERSAEFWKDFPLGVEDRIRLEAPGRRKFELTVWNRVESFLVFHRRETFALSGVLALCLIFSLTLKWLAPTPVEEVTPSVTYQPAQADTMSDHMAKYLRKSKVLLVGLTNMKLDDNEPPDLSVERQRSRELIREARFLKSRPMDLRSAKLIDDLERILIELANIEETNDLSNVEIIRGGIHQENLLFKIRMAEEIRDVAQYKNVKNKFY